MAVLSIYVIVIVNRTWEADMLEATHYTLFLLSVRIGLIYVKIIWLVTANDAENQVWHTDTEIYVWKKYMVFCMTLSVSELNRKIF